MERHWPPSWAEPDRRRAVLLTAGALALGVVSERAQFGLDDPARWAPDLAAGAALVVGGAVVARRQRSTGWLLVAAGLGWFLANLSPAALYWHRGPLFHAVSISQCGRRQRWYADGAFLLLVYGGASVPAAGRDERWNLATGAALVVMAGVNARGIRVGGRWAKAMASAGAAVGTTMIASVALRLAADDPRLWLLATHVFEAGIVAAAGLLAWGSRPAAVSEIADLVVHLDDARSPSVRDALAQVLGDPTLEIGFADGSGVFRDAQGEPVAPRATSVAGRVTTELGDPAAPFAVLLHDPAVLRDQVLVEAIAAVAHLARTHQILDRAVRVQLDDVAASRHRLVLAATEELRQLERRVRQGPEPRLRTVEGALAAISASERGPFTDGPMTHVEQARDHTLAALGDLHEIARGLYPLGLANGLAAALQELATRAPIEVELSIHERRTPPDDAAAAAYFVCAEALSNVAKHSSALSAGVDVVVDGQLLHIVVTDDGVGGADMSRGSGLRGIVDRVEAMGGRVTIDSAPSAGTRLVAELPLGDQIADGIEG